MTTKSKQLRATGQPKELSSALGVRLTPGQDAGSNRKQITLTKATQREAGGSEVGSFNLDLINRTVACARLNLDPDDPDAGRTAAQTSEAVIAAMRAFKPTDEVEAMLSAQAVALHHASLECSRRAMIQGQPSEIASKLRKDAANSARAMVDMIEALDRRCGKGPQTIRVERVVVQDGGQAVVAGSVVGGGVRPAPQAIGRGAPPMPMLDAEPVEVEEGEGT